jgi:hypothetical protein
VGRLPNLAVAQEALTIDAVDGVLRWKHDVRTESGRLTSTRAGDQAGGRAGVVRICGVYYRSLPIAWLLVHGTEPEGAVVPVDGDHGNLRPENLLDCGSQRASPSTENLTLEEALNAEEACAIFEYDAITGLLTWRCDRRTATGYFTARAGQAVGSLDQKGYLVCFFQPPRSARPRNYFVHRIVWLMQTGQWPAMEVDHRNGIKNDNRWDNLRHASDLLNSQNRRRANKNNAVGLLGVTLVRKTGKFASRIGHEGRIVALGTFDTATQAHEVYLAAKRRLHEGGTL